MALEDETDEIETPEGTDTTEDINEPEEIDGDLIELIVEDGSCISGANSYITLEEADKYQFSRNHSEWMNLDEEQKKAALIRGTQYVDNLFTWKGRRKYEAQELGFPRVKLLDLDGFEVRGIPKKVKDAVCEAAFYGYQSELFSTYSSEGGAVKRDLKEVSGAVKTEIEYFDSVEIDYISKYASLNSILKGLYVEKNARTTVNSRADWGW